MNDGQLRRCMLEADDLAQPQSVGCLCSWYSQPPCASDAGCQHPSKRMHSLHPCSAVTDLAAVQLIPPTACYDFAYAADTASCAALMERLPV